MAVTGLDLEVLRDVPESGNAVPHAYAVWTDRKGDVQMGPVRWKTVQTRGDAAGTYYSASPFPGAWTEIREDAFLRVRHLGAMSLHQVIDAVR